MYLYGFENPYAKPFVDPCTMEYKYDIVILTDDRYENPKKINWYTKQVLREDSLVLNALKEKGLKVIKKSWSCPDFNWSNCRYALFRTTWDYFDRFEEFMIWFNHTKHQTTFINQAELINWNIDKAYLKDLKSKEIEIAPTIFLNSKHRYALDDLFKQSGFKQAVLKPNVAGAARETYLIKKNEAHLYQNKLNQLISEESMLFQEFQHNIVEKGEMSIILIGGEYSHAVLKKAKYGDFRVQDDFGGSVHQYKPIHEEIEFAQKALDACPFKPCYARVDMFYDNSNNLALGELELIEPELWFRNCPDASHLLAKYIYEMYFCSD